MPADAVDGLLPVVPALPEGAVALHIGVHKTGTTSLQWALADARPQLASAGVSYPGRRRAHHGVAMAALGKTWGWQNRGGQPPRRQVLDRIAARTAEHRGRVIISSEHFCEADADTAAMVVDRLGGERVHVVVTLRSLASLLPSSWQQYLKFGLRATYPEWLDNTFEPETIRTKSPSFWKRNDHGALIERWAACVGPERLTVIVLEDVDRTAMFRTFAQLLDIDEQILVDRMHLNSNRSMTAQEAELLRLVNVEVRNRLTWGQYEHLVRNGVAREVVEGRLPAPDEPRVVTPDWALDAAAERGREAADRIAASGVRVVGDLSLLARRGSSGPPLGAEALDTVPMAVAARALTGAVLASGEEPSARQLAAQLARRIRSDARHKLRRGSS